MPDPDWYTGRGDDGYTGLLGRARVPKYDVRPEACGTVDEAQAAMGLARSSGCTARTGALLLTIQRDLQRLMAELASAGETDSRFAFSIAEGDVRRLEAELEWLKGKVELPHEFVLPGDSAPGAAIHLARTVVRRAERLVARMVHDGLLANAQLLHYINRLSSLLFALACYEDQAATQHRPTPAEGEAGLLP